jgi:lipopolysaccharide/colanic/teichoic acid biosynthesis glycosyltransferase
MLVIWLETPGSPLFRQTRIGRSGQPFRLYKLRTMVAGNSPAEHHAYVTGLIRGKAAAHAGMFKMVADPRITRVGRVLRRYSVDELPQLWNVLKGDMSLVGPRPPLPYEVDLYTAHDWRRLRVKPGLTGLWQVTGRSTMPFDEMVELDIRYWQTWTLQMELSILLRTPLVVVTGFGAA